MIDAILRVTAKCLLWLRYRVRMCGLEKIAARGVKGILFLPNHPALIDPIILATYLQKDFAAKFLADEGQIDRPVIRRLARRIGVRPIPSVVKVGSAGRERIEDALAESIEGLRQGENLVLYPGGHAMRGYLEDLRGNSGVETILKRIPDVRVVLVRTRGLWGSGFSWAGGGEPKVAKTLIKGAFSLLLSGVFFAPRREAAIELVEPTDFPRKADRETLNRFMERFYNAAAKHNTYVPYTPWERGGIRELPEAERLSIEGDLSAVPKATRKIVTEHLAGLTGAREIREEMHLARDLGMDSLIRADLIGWLGGEFGFPAGDADSLQTVGDVMLAACGEFIAHGPTEVEPVSSRWFREREGNPPANIPEGETITEVILRQAKRSPGSIIVADQTGGAKSWRDLIAAVMVLKGRIERIEGNRVGIMLPASVTADVLYLATLFAGKTPVMVNWTVGSRNVTHSLGLVGVQHILTSETLVKRLVAQGLETANLEKRFVYLEQAVKEISFFAKLRAWLMSRLSWASLACARVPETAAILFTSGSESLPKAVPLTHANLLTNIRDVTRFLAVRENDRLLGMLPPFHSFGLAETIILPLCMGMRTVYHPNPTEGAMLARLIEAYKVTLIIGTPSFLGGIVRASTPEKLSTLRVAVTGAEKCSERVYAALAERCPEAIILEGYGVTECSPIISVNHEKDPKPFTIGKVLPSFKHVLVHPESGRRISREDTAGMLLVRGPSVFGGYLNYDGPSPFVEFDGETWYRTGDLVKKDSDGTLTFCGRLKRFVKVGGEMISLPAIEAVLSQHYAGGVDEGPVIAIEATPSEEHPELTLFTTVDTDRETVNRQIRAAGLSPLHNVRRVIKLSEIPLLGTGKTDYRALKEGLGEELSAE